MGLSKDVHYHLHSFDLCTNEMEVVVNGVGGEEGLGGPKLMQHVILLLLYADNMVIFSTDFDGMHSLLGTLDAFCQSTGLTINMDKTKMMEV